MDVDIQLAPKQMRRTGQPGYDAIARPDVSQDQAVDLAKLAGALADPIRLQLVDVLCRHAGEVCVSELMPLFDVSQGTLSYHLKKLRDAGIVDYKRQGLWTYYYVIPDSLSGLATWLQSAES